MQKGQTLYELQVRVVCIRPQPSTFAAPAAATSHDRSLAARLYLIESEVLAATNHLTKAMAEGAIELPSHVSPE
jgi:hypothetical protein